MILANCSTANGLNCFLSGTGPGIESRLDKLKDLQTEQNNNNIQLDTVWRQHVTHQPNLLEGNTSVHPGKLCKISGQ